MNACLLKETVNHCELPPTYFFKIDKYYILVIFLDSTNKYLFRLFGFVRETKTFVLFFFLRFVNFRAEQEVLISGIQLIQDGDVKHDITKAIIQVIYSQKEFASIYFESYTNTNICSAYVSQSFLSSNVCQEFENNLFFCMFITF